MREVEVDRFIQESPRTIGRVLTPERIVEWEGSFEVDAVESVEDAPSDSDDVGTDDSDDAGTGDSAGDDALGDDVTVVTVSGLGVGFRLRFERRPDGYHYVAADDGPAGPFEHMETWLTVEPENEGSRVRFRSAVALNAPLPFADRIATWKRRGELERALDGLADAV